MAGPTAEEQLYIELINETRLDPMGNAARYITAYTPLTASDAAIQNALDYFDVDGAALLAAYAALSPVGPLAWNENLGEAARFHSAAMIAADDQQHQLPGEPDLVARIAAAGYTNWSNLGENVYAYSQSTLYGHAGFMVDWGLGADGMQTPPGHRNNIMLASFREIGVDVTLEVRSATKVGPQVVTQDLGARFNAFFVLGVAYSDNDADRFYSIGEGRGDLTVTAGAVSTTSAASGGYSLQVGVGAVSVTLSGGGLADALTVNTTIATENIKLDVVDGNTLLSSGSIVVTSGTIAVVRGLGVRGLSLTAGAGDQTIEGNAGDDTLTGGAGDDTLVGNGGIDTAVYTGNRADYLITREGQDLRLVDRRAGGGDGNDLTIGIARYQFADGLVLAADLAGDADAGPTGRADSYAGQEDTELAVAAANGVLANDTDARGGGLAARLVSATANGALTLAADGSFTYRPDADFNGTDVFTYRAQDAAGALSTVQAVTITVGAVNDAPRAVNDSARLLPNGSVMIAVLANDTDVDGDALSVFSVGDPLHGTATIGPGGLITYVPDAGYAGQDGFTYVITDSQGGRDTGTVEVFVGDPRFRLFAVDGFTGAVKGAGDVFGSNGFQDIVILADSGRISLDGSFTRGSDIVRLEGDASAYTIARSASSAVLRQGATEVTIPLGTAGLALVFDDGVRELVFDIAANSARIGAQRFDTVEVAVIAAADGTALPDGADPAVTARLVLAQNGETGIAGNFAVLGSNGADVLHVLGGSVALDGSFGRGGDVLSLPDAAGSYKAYLAGSQLVLLGGGGTVSIPVGAVGMLLDFRDDDRTLRYDAASATVFLGDQAIAATSIGNAEPLVAPGLELAGYNFI